MRLLSALVFLCLGLGCSGGGESDSNDDSSTVDIASPDAAETTDTGPQSDGVDEWAANVSVEAVSIDGESLDSSTRLTVTFAAYGGTVDHYEVSARESSTSEGYDLSESWSGSETTISLDGLRSDTEYEITVVACSESACENGGPSAIGTGRTAAEVWRIVGSGADRASVTELIENSNVQAHAFRFGNWAGSDLDGHVQLYYLPNRGVDDYGIHVAMTPSVVTDLATGTTFERLDGAGLLETNVEPPVYRFGGTPQAVPLSIEGDVRVRLFMEVSEPEMFVRLGYLDSQTPLGRDFHPGASTLCEEDDYQDGADCELSFIGLSGRQFKIAYPTADGSIWDGAEGTPMIITVHGPDVEGCSDMLFNAGYAIWDGENWELDSDGSGCLKLLPEVQAPSPLHLGGPHYKLYFTRNSVAEMGGAEGIKPFTVIYGDTRRSGDPDVLDFEDWESSQDDPRDIDVQWPDGSDFPADHETRLDDYAHIMPTNDPDLQLMYSNVSTPDNPVPIIGALRLTNP